MNKILQIEQEIQSMDGGAFQNLCDAYLFRKRNLENINPLGMLIGTNRVRQGTPDTFSRLPNGKFLFVEYSLQQTGLFAKINADLNKCFDETKTKVKVSEIQEIVYCYGSILSPEEEQDLQKICTNKGVVLSLYSIGTIAFDLYFKYPRLVDEYLGIKIDSGQIVSIEEFVDYYGTSKFAVPLNTGFHFREDELHKIAESLDVSNLVIVTGQPGVGKSRLVLEACRNFADAHSDYKTFSIINRSQDLFADLRDYFSPSGNYLIFVDDANRLSNFPYFVDLLKCQRSDQAIKVIVTVRNYALEKIRELSKEYGEFAEINVDKLTDDQIKKLVGDEFSITNNYYLERIAEIAKGNPRIAIMAAKVAIEANRLDSINDVSKLYHEYFSTIKRDIDTLTNPNILKVAGILSFYRAVDRLNEQQMSVMQSVFKMSADEFWDAVLQLHKIEVADVYENEVAKLSDQVLSTYLFYLAFFRNRVLDFSVILQNFFPSMRSRIVDSLSPVVSAFDRNTVEEIIRPQIEQKWQQLLSTQNDAQLLTFSQTFWPLLQTQVLDFIRLQIQSLETAPVTLAEIKFKPESNIPENSFLTILAGYNESAHEYASMALRLILDYVERRPQDTPFVLKTLSEDYGYSRHIYYRGTDVQKMVVELLWKKAEQGKNPLFTEIFIAVSERYLYTYIKSDEIKHSGVLTIYNFQIPARSDVFDLRKSIWERLFSLYKNREYSQKVLDLLHKYSTDYHNVSEREIIAQDSEHFLGFISSNLEPQRYQHDVLVQDYLDFLKHHDIPFDETLRISFSGETYHIHELIFEDWLERRNYEYKEHQRIKKERFVVYFSEFTFDDFKGFLSSCITIRKNLSTEKNLYDLTNGVLEALIALSEVNPPLFIEAIEHYLEDGEQLNLPYATPIIHRLLSLCAKEHVYQILSNHSYFAKRQWIFGYYQMLSSDQIASTDLVDLLSLYKESDPLDLPYHLDYLLKYRRFDKDVVANVTSIVLEKGDDVYCPAILAFLTNPHSEVNKGLLNLFANHIDLLKKAYFFVLQRGKHDDYDSSTLLKILEVDPSFIGEYFNYMYSPRDTKSMWDYRDPDFSLLWLQANYEEIISKITMSIFAQEKSHYYTDLRKFFSPHGDEAKNQTVLARQDEYLQKTIKAECDDSDFVAYLFDVISDFSATRKIKLLSSFLDCNKKFDDFKNLQIEPKAKSWSGSQVPVLQEEIDFYDSILLLLNTIELLPHRNYIEQRISGLKKHLKSIIRSEFIGDE
jgi:hypothetical protein